jgi:CelD/BcsL family acetyltransferase involved in cellulose biosynthesis
MDAAWQRLQRSGVIQERDILSIGTESLKEVTAKVESVAAAKAVARGLRSCALAACAAREVHASQFKACGACKTVVYCSREHQLADWPAHKAACKAARKASAVSAAQSDA